MDMFRPFSRCPVFIYRAVVSSSLTSETVREILSPPGSLSSTIMDG
jgi:hypothetical protein